MNSFAIRDLVESNFEVVDHRSTSVELCFICPECDDTSGHRSVNLNSGLTNCFKCGRGYHIEYFLRRHGVEVERGSLGASREGVDLLRLLKGRKSRRPDNKLQLPAGFTPLADDSTVAPGRVHSVRYERIAEMAERKRLTIEDLIEAGAGYTREGRWEPYCIFPIHASYGALSYFQGRAYEETTIPGKRFPSREDAPHGMAFQLYGVERLLTARPKVLVLVESILNVLSLRRGLREAGLADQIEPISSLHAGLTREQVSTLAGVSRRMGIQEWCILWDHDATAKAAKAAADILRRNHLPVKLTLAEMPDTCGPKTDPNDDVTSALRAIQARRRASSILTIQLTGLQALNP